jgi:hypothetical protein
VDNFDISHSEKDFLGGGGEGKRRVVLYRGTLSSQCGLDDISGFSLTSAKTASVNASRKPQNRL